MKSLLHAFAMCQSMFCAIPFPCHIWDNDARGKMLVFLPVIGLEIGFLWALAGFLGRYLSIHPMVIALILTVLPYLLSGFIHLDGFMDVTDAVGSCRDLEKRRAILKDSHVGAFAVIGVVLLMIASFALFSAVKPETSLWPLILAPCISRTAAGIAVLTLPKMTTSQYQGQEVNKGQLIFMSLVLIASLTADFVIFGLPGLSGLACAAVCGLAIFKGYRSLKGMNGDISGYAITLGELAAAAVLALC